MQWLIDIIKEWIESVPYATQAWVEAKNYLTYGYVDRGDPATRDFTLANFTRDVTWHDLSLTLIIPNNAIAVAVNLRTKNVGIGAWGQFRKNGNVNSFNISMVYMQIANLFQSADFIIAVDEWQSIEYRFTPAGWTDIDFTVKGWWI